MPASGGTGTLFVDGKPIATGHVPKTQPFSFSADEAAVVGIDNETAVSTDYEPVNSKFTGQIESVTIAVSPSKLTAADQKVADDAGEAANKADD
jgi:arylsulfatase